MDRLIIESTLSDLTDVYFSGYQNNDYQTASIVLGFKASNTDQIIHAFTALKKIAGDQGVEFMICRTLQSGIYDLEIKTEALDEPVRIMNKAITNEKLGEIEDQIRKNTAMTLSANVSEEENHIKLGKTEIRDCHSL